MKCSVSLNVKVICTSLTCTHLLFEVQTQIARTCARFQQTNKNGLLSRARLLRHPAEAENPPTLQLCPLPMKALVSCSEAPRNASPKRAIHFKLKSIKGA
ncbi:hypothetical protein DVZ91_02495 [Staphylococcus pseudintermedius]|nr:hypothetical protein [Staphylococcus pseudintermedius]EGQ1782526.1 hypothetical protein [Staphylococcus pseudintermedius]